MPNVVDELSTGRVLTTELADGARFAEVERWSQAERNLAGEAIYRFVFRSIYELHAFNGDPHPGNYLFRPGGRVTFLDFGLVKRYRPEEVDAVRVVDPHVRGASTTSPAFRRLMEEHDVLRRDPALTDADVAGYFGHFYELVIHDREFTVDPEYSSETVRMYFDANGPYAHVARASNVPPAFVITQRINLGPHRGARAAAHDREFPPDRGGAVAVRRGRTVDADGRGRSRLALRPRTLTPTRPAGADVSGTNAARDSIRFVTALATSR